MSQDKRKKVLEGNKRKRFRIELVIPIIVIAVGVIWITQRDTDGGKGKSGNAAIKYEKIKADEGVITIPASVFESGEAKYFQYQFPEKEIFFFAVKSSDGVVRAAFDACDVCFEAKKGYRQDGDIMVCNNCGQQFPTSRINVEKGGCNPAPLERELVGNQLIVQVSDLYQGIRYF